MKSNPNQIFGRGLGVSFFLAFLIAGLNSTAQAALIGKWTFNEGGGTEVRDESGNGHTGQLMNGATCVSSGHNNKAVSLDGVKAFVDFGTDPAFDLADKVSLEVWVKPNEVPASEPMLLGKDVYVYALTYVNGAVFAYAPTDVHISAKVSPEIWTHVVMTNDGSTLRLYLNGAPAGKSAKTSGAVPPTANRPLRIGSSGPSYGKAYLNGLVDEARLYNNALTADEVSASYEAGPTLISKPKSHAWIQFGVTAQVAGFTVQRFKGWTTFHVEKTFDHVKRGKSSYFSNR
ncbi:MAG: LamG domain-containing protein [Verrucomicrobia bacterium]|nr:LamG domain-containing protein [Verrucomicrobiota bacterium]